MKALKRLVELYKIPVLVSLTLFIVFLALTVLRDPVNIVLTLFGALAGTFTLDLDYFIYAYFTDPSTDFAQTLRGYFKHKDYTNAISYIYYHREDIKEKTLQSAMFQIVIGALSFFMVFAPINFFAKALIISTYVNSLYRLAEMFFENPEKAKSWFWMLKEKPSPKGVKVYLAVNVIALLIILQFL